jgi:glycosyltransferase involved in cell wall biosynthesis
MLRAVARSTFAIAWNGSTDTPPASSVREFLLRHGARRVTTIQHPLEPEDGRCHRIILYEHGLETQRRTLPLPSRPPYTYALDPLIPPWPPSVDAWIAFNNLTAAKGLVQRSLGRAGKVVYWPIDFVPDRFGTGVVTRAYDKLDEYCCRHVDARVEVTKVARDARNERHGLVPSEVAPTEVLPLGAWSSRPPVVPVDGWRRRRVIWAGHLIERQGVAMLLEALAVLKHRGVAFTAAIAGHGPLLGALQAQSARLAIDDRVEFVGFISDPAEVERYVASGSVAVAPYDTAPDSLVRFADPSKLHFYTGAGLPIVMTDVPPNASELAAAGGAELVPFTPEGIADGIARALDSPGDWQRRRQTALAYARRFDWEYIAGRALAAVGFGI